MTVNYIGHPSGPIFLAALGFIGHLAGVFPFEEVVLVFLLIFLFVAVDLLVTLRGIESALEDEDDE